ncbi:BTAD domain-containing putative transcriptional regulator [Streptomyces sp. NPDC059446]|uniref:BTAD domain-containing putative transcriptional regulator n=1 Tax=Streptomyces sp. NPDC059446 TaxID=3346833 RepID=UPI0036C2FB27
MPREAVRVEGRARTGEAHLPELVRLNAVHPLRERRTPLLRTLADSGREVEALDAYTRIHESGWSRSAMWIRVQSSGMRTRSS